MSRLLLSANRVVDRQKVTCCALVALSALSNASSFTSSSPLASAFFHKTTTRMASSLGSFKAGNLEIVQVPCLSDNYGWLVHDSATGSTAVIDTPEAKPYEVEMQKRGWKLTHIFNTHQ